MIPRSLWWETLPAGLKGPPRPPLPGDASADVAVVGGGYTGLWTAYYLLRADPSLRVVVLEREVAGYGASGRNGGWCSALFPVAGERLAREHGRQPALAMLRHLQRSVDEVGAVAEREGIDCHYAKGGTVVLARSGVQLERARAEVEAAHELGLAADDVRLLSAVEARERVGATEVRGATYTPHCAAIHPARLVRGLAHVVERLGGRIHEGTAVTEIGPGFARTPTGTLRAAVVVRATEGYTAGLRGHKRDVAPVYSLMLATEPLAGDVLDAIGLARRETFADERHLIIYGQRTADDRIAFGGRGAPYHYGSQVRPHYDEEPRVFADLREVLVDLFPALADTAVTHTWGGPLGITRDWFPSVGLDRPTGLGWAGGYVGDGVAATNLAGRTLADLVLRRDTERVHLPWVGHRSRRWEPEPLRWVGVNAGLRVMSSADRVEERTGRSARRARVMSRFLGG
jgi:glycine/D-amino acid oxidase-like deaminating enzyme